MYLLCRDMQSRVDAIMSCLNVIILRIYDSETHRYELVNQLIGGKVGVVTNWTYRRVLMHQSA